MDALAPDNRTIIERKIKLGFGLVNRDAQRLLDELKRVEAKLDHKTKELETVELLRERFNRRSPIRAMVDTSGR